MSKKMIDYSVLKGFKKFKIKDKMTSVQVQEMNLKIFLGLNEFISK